jgi:hypothetical protein
MKAYRVVKGTRRFQGHAPGEQFEADLDPEQERRAVARGQIEVLDGQVSAERSAPPEQEQPADEATVQPPGGASAVSLDDVSADLPRGELEEIAVAAGVDYPERRSDRQLVEAIRRARS